MAHALYMNQLAPAILAADISASDLSITLQTGQGAMFPVPTGGNYFYATIFPAESSFGNAKEIVKCTANVADILTVIRGQQTAQGSQAASAHYAGDKIEIRTTAGGFQEFVDDAAQLAIDDTNSVSAKVSLVDADIFPVGDSAASFILVKGTLSNLLTYIFSGIGARLNSATSKATPIDADSILIQDSAASNNTKQVTWANLKATLLTYFQNMLFNSGDLKYIAHTTVPTGWLYCNGGVVSQTTYADLYAKLGTTWNTGGEGAGNFRLPDFRGRTLIGDGTGSGLTARIVGQQAIGEETHAQTAAEMPTHTHAITDPGHTHTVSSAQQLASSASGDVFSVTGVTNTGSNTTGITINNAGSGTAFNVMQPSAVIKIIIKT